MLLSLGIEELSSESKILFVGGGLVGPCWKLVELHIRGEVGRVLDNTQSILWNWKAR